MEHDHDPPNQRPTPSQKPARELKVEDALLYLDQVKMEFSDKPQIYNEFLDIMKNFKAQSINTPGVIERVKNLFRGYNKLILGFNTFLPEGEGYKIELTPEEQAFNHPGQEVPAHGPHMASSSSSMQTVGGAGALPGAPGSVGAVPGAASGLMGGNGGAPGAFPGMAGAGAPAGYYGPAGGLPGSAQGAGVPGGAMPPQPMQAQMGPGVGPGAAGMNPGNAGQAGPPGAQAQQPGQMQQAHAIHYVTKIRNRFSSEPDTYRSFLKILHTYQKEQKGIKEVLEQVSQLFADHPDLLMEFTYFLPDAVQEQAKERLHRAARESEARRLARMQAGVPPAGKGQGQRKGGPQMGGAAGMQLMRGPNGEMLMPPGMMQGNAMMMDGGAGGMAGNKRARNSREDVRGAMAGAVPGMLPHQYGMQMPGNRMMVDPQGKNMMNYHMAQMMGNPQQMSEVGAPPPKKANRRKNAAVPPGMIMMADGTLVSVSQAMGDMKAPGGVGGLTQQQHMMLLQQQQQSLAHQMLQQQHHAQAAAQQQLARSKEALMSVSAERRYFEQVKEVLTATSRETWNEFVKVLELFSNDVVTKEDCLDLIGDLFGPQHNDLFHEFKRLLNSREEYEEHKSDVWYAVPLSEIDFTQCRKCTPSYRALPKDYPKAKCTERSEEEARVLNDQWVSIPIGSEESYSFKHMRKNQFEEALFKVEDERFEVDMVIDANMCTIRVLEPLAEEIATMKAVEALPRGAASAADGNGSAASVLGASAANIAPRFTFQLEKRHLSTIHLNSIARIYGEHGEEILELLRRNPAGTIPVLLKRLKQKDMEWRRARAELNKGWKDTVERNHARSFDHRSFYFRQQDKKYLSTKHLVSEITALAQPAAAPVVVSTATPLTAAAATSAAVNTNPSDVNAIFEDPESTALYPRPTPEAEHLLAGMSPHIVLSYSNDAHLVHRDIYRIMCHAAETTLTSSADKERLAALWRDLLRVFFNIPVHYLYQPAVPTTQSSAAAAALASAAAAAEDGSAMAVDPTALPAVPPAAYRLSASDAWPPRTKVITTYGRGEVISFREQDNMYSVQLPFGVAFLAPAAVYGSEQLSANALYVIGVTPSEKPNEPDTIYNGLVNTAPNPAAETVADPSKLFYGTQMCYIFMRLHHALYVRLRTARQLAAAAARANRNAPASGAHTADSEGPGKPVYNYFLGQVLSLVEGTLDNGRFEEFCRSLLGNKSYVLYTLDKLIAQTVKHLQAMANDENVTKLVGLFVYHHHSGRAVDPAVYRDHVACILSHTMEDVFRIQLMAAPECVTSTGHSQVGVQHLGILTPPSPSEADEAAAAEEEAALTLDTAIAGPVPPPQSSPRAASAMAITASLRARGGSMVLDTAAANATANSAAGQSAAGRGLTVAGKTPKAVVSDDEGSSSSEDEEAEEGRGTTSVGENEEGGSDADTDDARARGRGGELNPRHGLFSPSRRASLAEYPEK